MSMHVPALHAPPVTADGDDVAAARERRRQFVESLFTTVVAVVTIAAIAIVGVAFELS
ncbi:hypothetical protein RA307_11125 [Xanthobacteraceae bacterium Astr-EGSB]|uniref:hypothetical protein n=1 Tax=Astrobacterium formosum TaxID=3069710 RepID=UPI0027AEF3D4|nr:hypothetical protein [Xanthobacteraceae bacterium Astr-EGSB]